MPAVLLSLYIASGLFFLAPPDSVACTEIKRMLEGFLSQDLRELPDVGAFGGRLDVLRSEPAADIRRVLPVALSLLRSENPNHQSIGSVALIAIALRLDSAALLGPDIPELVALLEAHDRTHDGTALGFLTLLNPKPPATLIPFLLPRLLNSKASTEKLLSLSGTLLRAAPDDPAVVGAILNLLQEHPEPAMKAEIVRMMGAAHVVSERTLALFGAGLVDPNPDIRLMAVQSVAWQRPETIRLFAPQLRKIAADPYEQPSTRDFASRAIEPAKPQ